MEIINLVFSSNKRNLNGLVVSPMTILTLETFVYLFPQDPSKNKFSPRLFHPPICPNQGKPREVKLIPRSHTQVNRKDRSRPGFFCNV